MRSSTILFLILLVLTCSGCLFKAKEIEVTYSETLQTVCEAFEEAVQENSEAEAPPECEQIRGR